MKKENATFGSRLGVICATVGSAVGLGNIWRFPAEAQSNGGAAFLLLYVGCVFLLGVPVMLAEFALGRAGRSDAVGAFRNLARSRGRLWSCGGGLAILASYLILCFYMVVAGWTLEYLWQSVTGALYSAGSGSQQALEAGFHQRMEEYICSGRGPLLNTFLMILINLGILLMGVRKGIERISNFLMPLLFLLLVIFSCFSLSLPGAAEGLRFFFTPDFSKITPAVAVNALGQAFFSLSLGMGILITYASYYPKETRLGQTGVTVALLDLLVAVLMGVIIFPAVASFGLEGEGLRGTTLVFVTLPEVFAQMPGTQIWSILFFTLLTVAALTSTISIAEVSVAYVQDHFRRSRVAACLIVLTPLFLFSSICALSFSELSDWTVAGMTVFDLLDTVATNYMLPVVSIIVCLFMGWGISRTEFLRELTNGRMNPSAPTRLTVAIIRYLAPALIFVILAANFISF